MKKLILGAFLLASFAAYGVTNIAAEQSADVTAKAIVLAPLTIEGSIMDFGSNFTETDVTATSDITVTGPAYDNTILAVAIAYGVDPSVTLTNEDALMVDGNGDTATLTAALTIDGDTGAGEADKVAALPADGEFGYTVDGAMNTGTISGSYSGTFKVYAKYVSAVRM